MCGNAHVWFDGRGREDRRPRSRTASRPRPNRSVKSHGYAKQGAAYGYTRTLGYHPILATRADSGFWSHRTIKACVDHDVRYSITVRATKPVVAAIDVIVDTAWVDIAYPDGGKAQVAETTLAGRRLVVRRTRLTGAPEQRLWPDWRHHAFVTDRSGDAIDLHADHRRHAVVELAIRDLKHGAGLVHCPPGVFTANAAWAVFATLAHNLLRWTATLGGLGPAKSWPRPSRGAT
ncbi:hypothetical protein BH23ACT10_BH23ACT10_12300 [soil metagenome]